MSTTWVLVLVLAAVSISLRVAVPLAAGGRELPGWLRSALAAASPTLIAAMVVVLLWPASSASLVHTITALAGVGTGIALLAARRSILTAMLVAAAVCAALRLVL